MAKGITITVISNRFPELARKLPQATGRVVQATLFAIESKAKIFCPVDTGNLRASIQTEMEEATSGVVYTNVTYAPYQEYGTIHQGGTPFFTPAAEGERAHFNAEMAKLEAYLE